MKSQFIFYDAMQGLLNISLPWQIQAQEDTAILSWRECSKKSVQQGREWFAASRQGATIV